MYQELKKEISTIIEIVKQCPESLQEKCFELLLNNYISSIKVNAESVCAQAVSTSSEKVAEPLVVGAETTAFIEEKDEEIQIKDFHVKLQRLLTTNGITVETINQLYYKENGKIMPLYDSLRTTKMSECQTRLILLTAFENAYNSGTGDLVVNGEEVRQRCQTMKCYDSPNFATNFKKCAAYFDNWNEKYDKNAEYTISVEGKKELVAILIDLAKE